MPESNKATGISDHGTTCRRLAPRQFGRNGAHTPKAEEAGAASAAGSRWRKGAARRSATAMRFDKKSDHAAVHAPSRPGGDIFCMAS